jgi:hypothetical protein
MTEASQSALEILRDTHQFQWYVIPIFVIVVYIYASEVYRREWSIVLAGIAFWGMDLFNEIWNGLVFHFTQYSACWTTPGKTAFLIFIGLNIEITMMFAILGICFVKILPKDKTRKILGIPNRWFFVVINSVVCVFIEVLLNLADALIWEYRWWNIPHVWLIILLGYMPFMIVSFWVYDMHKIRNKIATVSTILAVDAVLIILFAVVLKWI